MINLLPPLIKEQIAFSKLNRVVVRYFWVVGLVVVVLGGVFGATSWYLNQRLAATNRDIASKQAEIATFSGLQTSVKGLNDTVAAIKKIQAGQAKFSDLLTDLAKAMPAGASLASITLTGDDKKPVAISANADSYNNALALRDTLAASSRILAADIQSVSTVKDGYHVEILLSFKPGQSK